jgi:hypothetical protein
LKHREKYIWSSSSKWGRNFYDEINILRKIKPLSRSHIFVDLVSAEFLHKIAMGCEILKNNIVVNVEFILIFSSAILNFYTKF